MDKEYAEAVTAIAEGRGDAIAWVILIKKSTKRKGGLNSAWEAQTASEKKVRMRARLYGRWETWKG